MTNNQPHILVISLREAHERRALASQQLDASGLRWNFLDAVSSKDLQKYPVEYARTKRLHHAGKDMTPGEIACFLSHRMAWISCIHNQKPALILEDDFLLRKDLQPVFDFIAYQAPAFDILRLQGINEVKFKMLKEFGDKKLVNHLDDPGGAAAYMLKPDAAKILVEKSKRFFIPVDDFIAQDWKHCLKIIAWLPYPIGTQEISSTIGQRVKPSLSVGQKIFRELYRLPGGIRKKLYYLWKILRV